MDHSPVMEPSHGLCFPTFRLDSSGVGEVAGVARSVSDSHRPFLASEGMVPRTSRSPGRASSGASTQVGSFTSATREEFSSALPCAKASCLETLQQFARVSGFSSMVAKRLGRARRASSVANYQSKWDVHRKWCADTGQSVCSPSVSKVADSSLVMGDNEVICLFY